MTWVLEKEGWSTRVGLKFATNISLILNTPFSVAGFPL